MTDLTVSTPFFPIFSVWKGHHRGLAATLRLARGVEVQPVTWLVEDGSKRRRKSRAKKTTSLSSDQFRVYRGCIYMYGGWKIIGYIYPTQFRGYNSDLIICVFLGDEKSSEQRKKGPWLFSLGFLSGMKYYPSYVGIVIIKPWNENPVINQPLWCIIMSGGPICFFFEPPFSVGFYV